MKIVSDPLPQEVVAEKITVGEGGRSFRCLNVDVRDVEVLEKWLQAQLEQIETTWKESVVANEPKEATDGSNVIP